ncbi:hypothetical protein F5X97DRAFT_171574 [Nemania serpens]|nr:hypothetical protein F5X97DRAFT_171574 [Nemania serpens]
MEFRRREIAHHAAMAKRYEATQQELRRDNAKLMKELQATNERHYAHVAQMHLENAQRSREMEARLKVSQEVLGQKLSQQLSQQRSADMARVQQMNEQFAKQRREDRASEERRWAAAAEMYRLDRQRDREVVIGAFSRLLQAVPGMQEPLNTRRPGLLQSQRSPSPTANHFPDGTPRTNYLLDDSPTRSSAGNEGCWAEDGGLDCCSERTPCGSPSCAREYNQG